MRVRFYARRFAEMVIEITAEEYSGVVPPENFLNFWGLEGTLTLRHVQSNATIAVQLYPIAYNTFEGVVPLTMLPVGLYQLQGLVSDAVGNAAIISAYHEPLDLPTQTIEVLLEEGYGIVPVWNVGGSYTLEYTVDGEWDITLEVTTAPISKLREVNLKGKYEQEMQSC
jgi:hypothetical protein